MTRQLNLGDDLKLKTVFKWEIKDFINRKENKIKSVEFSLVSFEKITFVIELFSLGEHTKQGYLLLYLLLGKEFPKEDVNVEAEFALIDNKVNKFVKYSFAKIFDQSIKNCGFVNYYDKNKIIDKRKDLMED